MTAKYGTPYFQNFINSPLDPGDIRSMCCRLQLDKTELERRGNGLFGSAEFTGSIGVVTINMPRIAYISKTKEEFYERLHTLMDMARDSLEIKRKVIEQLMDAGLFPYSKRYLGHLNNHFSTIGFIGMNEACLNAPWIKAPLYEPEAHEFTLEVMDFMRDRLLEYQKETDNLYNLEATPAEGASYRLALHDKKRYPEIVTAGTDEPYYTNSFHLPVDYTTDALTALDLQDPLQLKPTGGTVFHLYLGERISSWEAARSMVKLIAENYKLPYFTLSPTYSVCPKCGYLPGEQATCPKCGSEAEIYSRITGYYRPVKQWNDGKAEEFKYRTEYGEDSVDASNKSLNVSLSLGEAI